MSIFSPNWNKIWGIPNEIKYGYLFEDKKYSVQIKPKIENLGECSFRLYAKIDLDEIVGVSKGRTITSMFNDTDIIKYKKIFSDDFLLDKRDSWETFLYNLKNRHNLEKNFSKEVFGEYIPMLLDMRKGTFNFKTR